MAVLTILLFRPILGMTFPAVDAPTILFQAIKYSPSEFLFTPEIYQLVSPNNFTPGVALSWLIDYKVAGLNPRFYFIHQILSGTLFILLFYALARKVSNSSWIAFLCSLCFLLTPAMLDVVTYLACRHYVEGGIFALASTLLYIKYLERSHIAYLLVSAVLFFAATLCKEIYAPLPAILFFIKLDKITIKTLWQRSLIMLPYAAACILYIVWRVYLLDGFGGYPTETGNKYQLETTTVTFGKPVPFWFTGLQKIIVIIFGGPTQAISFFIFVLFGTILIIKRQVLSNQFSINWGIIGLIISTIIAALLPLYFLWAYMSALIDHVDRWVLVPTLALFIFLAWFLAQLDRPLQIIAAILFIGLYIPKGFHLITKPDTIKYLQPLQLSHNTYKNIGSPDVSGAIYFTSKSNLYGREIFSVWPNVKKIHNGQWGAMPIIDPVQFLFHDIKTVHTRNLKPLKTPPLETLKWRQSKLIKTLSFNEKNSSYEFGVNTGKQSGGLFLYFFTDKHGFIVPLGNISPAQVRIHKIPNAFLKQNLLKSGLDPDTVKITAWLKIPRGRGYKYIVAESKPLSDIVDVDPLKP